MLGSSPRHAPNWRQAISVADTTVVPQMLCGPDQTTGLAANLESVGPDFQGLFPPGRQAR
jgi:hypothetical protein